MVKSAKRDLELRYLPTSAEEKLFQPFRKKLHAIVGDSFLDASEFTTVRKLGSGAFGDVHLSKWRRRGFDTIEVAVKTMHGDKLKYKRDLESLLSEISCLNALSHPKIVRFFGIVWPVNAFPGIVSVC